MLWRICAWGRVQKRGVNAGFVTHDKGTRQRTRKIRRIPPGSTAKNKRKKKNKNKKNNKKNSAFEHQEKSNTLSFSNISSSLQEFSAFENLKPRNSEGNTAI